MPFPFSYWQQLVSELFANTKSLFLDGVDDYVTMGTIDGSDPLALSSGDFTVSVWAKSNGNNTSFGRIIEKSTGSYANGWGIFMSAANDIVYFWVNGSLSALYAIPSDKIGKWNNFSMRYNSSTQELDYLFNGSVVGTKTSVLQPQAVSAELRIGNWFTSGCEYNGNIDQPTVWNKRLTLAEIRELITKRDVSQHSAYANNIFWMEFEDADISGTTVTAKNGGVNGTLTNGATNSLCIPYPYPYQLETDNYTPLEIVNRGWAWDFGGVNEYISIPDSNDFTFGNGTTDSPFSISIWVKLQPADVALQDTICAKENEWRLRLNIVGRIYFELYTNASNYLVRRDSDNFAAALGSWTHIVCTYDGSGLNSGQKIYVNGVQADDANQNTGTYVAMSNTTNPVTIGSNGTANYLDGLATDFIVFDKELSSAEVSSLYSNHAPQNEMSESLSGNILGYWSGYNSETGTGNVPDLSGNAHNGTMTNMTNEDVVYNFPRKSFDLQNGVAGCVGYDDNTEYIEVPTTNDFNFSDGSSDQPFTIITRFKVESSKNYVGFAKVAKQWHFGVGAGNQLELERRDGTLNYIYRRNRTAAIPSSINDTWAHAVASFDGTNVTMYLNAEELANTETENLTYVTMADRGQTLRMNNGLLTGSISRPWKQSHLTVLKGYALNQCQVQEVYNEGSPTDPTQWTFIDDVPAKSHWNFNQDDDLTTSGGVLDIFNGHDGTGVNLVAGDLETDDYPTN